MDNSKKAAVAGIGVLLGVAIGLAAGILYTTMSGKQARELLREKERQARYKSAEYAERARDAISEARKRAKPNQGEA